MDHLIDETELVPRKKAKTRFREQILNEWNYCCAYCAEPLGKNATLDHVKPKWKGGLTEKANLVGCCFSCNSHKSATTGANGSGKEPTGPKPAKHEYRNGWSNRSLQPQS